MCHRDTLYFVSYYTILVCEHILVFICAAVFIVAKGDALTAAVLGCFRLAYAAKVFITDHGYDPVYGARPLKRYLQKNVETLAARIILADGVGEGSVIVIDVDPQGDHLTAKAE